LLILKTILGIDLSYR